VIVVITKLNVHPEKRQEFLQTVLALTDPMREESGCKGFGFYVDVENDGSFSLIEEWETRAQFDRHLESERCRVLSGAMNLLCESPDARSNTFSEIGLIFNRFSQA